MEFFAWHQTIRMGAAESDIQEDPCNIATIYIYMAKACIAFCTFQGKLIDDCADIL